MFNTYIMLLVLIFAFYSIKTTHAKDVIISFDEYIRKVGTLPTFENDDIVKVISFEPPHVKVVKIQDLNEKPEFYDSIAIHSGVEYNPNYYFELGSFEYHIYDETTDKQCIKRSAKEAIHYGAISIIRYTWQLLGNSVLCIGIFLHAI